MPSSAPRSDPGHRRRLPARPARLSRAARRQVDPRRRRLRAAAVAVALLGLLTYVIFGGRAPWAAAPFTLRATFAANTELHIPSPVRIAGVDAGEVTGVRAIPGSPDTATIVMRLDSSALPIHAGATATIRSRTFLEGNFYVALTQGDPSAPALASGATLPVTATSGPVQFDRILSSLDAPARGELAALLQGLGRALSGGGAAALHRAIAASPAALTQIAQVDQALGGTHPGDLAGATRGLAATLGALRRSGDSLPGLVDGFEATMATLASRQDDLSATLAALPGTLAAADEADTGLDATLPRLGADGVALEPALQRLNPSLTVLRPWLGALGGLLDERHLGGLSRALAPAVAHGVPALAATRALLVQLDALARCGTRDLVPTGNQVIADPGADPSGRPLYEELLQSFVGLASASQNFDGNGRYLRASTGGGSILVQTRSLPVNGPLFANAVLAPLGSRPALPASAPAVDLHASCAASAAPDLNAVRTGGTP